MGAGRGFRMAGPAPGIHVPGAMGVWGSGVLVMAAMATAPAPPLLPVPILPPGAPALEAERPAEEVPAPGTLIHPLRIELDAPIGGWSLSRLEILLDGELLAQRPLTSPAFPAEAEEAWSGPVAGGEHVLTVVLV